MQGIVSLDIKSPKESLKFQSNRTNSSVSKLEIKAYSQWK
jgi:hypothetical protein